MLWFGPSMSSFVTGSAYLQLPRDPQRWIIKDLIPTSGLTNIFGRPKSGKTFAAQGMALAVSGHAPHWLSPDFPIYKHGPVAYFQLDTPRGEFIERFETFHTKGHDIDTVHICDMLMVPTYPFNIVDSDHMKWLKAEMAELKPVLVIIDTLREVHAGDENDSTVMRNVIVNIVSATMPAAVVLLSHSRKENAQSLMGGDDLMTDNRGSSYIPGRMDTIIKFTKSQMQYQGRSVGLETIAIKQDSETGLIVLDPKAAAYHDLLRMRSAELLKEDADHTINSLADILVDETDYRKKSTIMKNLRELHPKLARK